MSWQEEKKEYLDELSHLRYDLRIEKQTKDELLGIREKLMRELAQEKERHHAAATLCAALTSELKKHLTVDDDSCECGNQHIIDFVLARAQYSQLYEEHGHLTLFLAELLMKVRALLDTVGPTEQTIAILKQLQDYTAESRARREQRSTDNDLSGSS